MHAHICTRAAASACRVSHRRQVRARLVAAALHPSCASKDSCVECLNNAGAFGPPALAGAVALILAESAVCLQPLQLLALLAHSVGAAGVLYSPNLPQLPSVPLPPVPGHSGLRCACGALGGCAFR